MKLWLGILVKALLLSLSLVLSSSPDSLHNNDDPTTRIERILRSEHANYTQFLRCLDDIPPGLVPYSEHYRKKTREPKYSQLPCSPQPCFRTVLDGYDHLLSLSLEDMADQVAEIMYQRGLVSREHPIESSIRRQQTFSGRSAANGQNPFGQFHMDYFEVPDYVVTGLLYREPSQDLQGGETGFADAFEGDPSSGNYSLSKGLLVEPKKGRLLMFSGGGESFHGPLPIRKREQERPTVILFFKCREELRGNKQEEL